MRSTVNSYHQDQNEITTFREQDASLEAFYNELDKGEESFLGNRFID